MFRSSSATSDSSLPLIPAMLVFAGLFVLPLAYFLVISFWTVRARMMQPALSLANYAEALKAWRGKAQATIDNAHMRYFVVHLHRLLDPAHPAEPNDE